VTDRLRNAAKIIALAAIYLVVARAGLMLDAVAGFATLVWPPTGIALAALLCFGFRLWPGVALGAFLANVLASAPLPVALGIAAGNTLEALAAAYVLRRVVGFRGACDRLRDVLGLVLFAAVGSTMISATIGVLCLLLGGIIAADHFADTWRAWWIGDLIADLVVAPVLVVWSTERNANDPRRRALERAALGVAVVAVTLLIYQSPAETEGATSILRQSYVFFPLLMWAALRFGQRETITTTFIVAAIAVAGTAFGRGPFVAPSLHQSLFSLQTFMAVSAATFLVLGASISERRQAASELLSAQEGLETTVKARTLALTNANAELRQAEEALRKARDELELRVEERTAEIRKLLADLEEAVHARDALISIASHELRTPLSALQLLMHLVTRDLAKGPNEEPSITTLASRFSSIDRQVARITRLVDNLLDVSRITAGKLQLEYDDVDLTAAVRDIVSRFEEELRRAGRSLSLRATGPVVGQWDRMRLEQIATNLLSNAVKYGANKPIEVTVEGTDGTARLIVCDHGIGIAEKDKARIFERFERLVSGSQAGGFGLGLWIVREIVQALGGTIRVDSEVGVGTTFTVELPTRRLG
jgi:two-component system, NarL family, sensor histidine kinase FusK